MIPRRYVYIMNTKGSKTEQIANIGYVTGIQHYELTLSRNVNVVLNKTGISLIPCLTN